MLDILEDENKLFFKAGVYLTVPKDGTMSDEDTDEDTATSVEHLPVGFWKLKLNIQYTNGEVKNSMEEMEEIPGKKISHVEENEDAEMVETATTVDLLS